MGISTFDEATRPGGTGYVVTFYKLDCPKCGCVTVGQEGDRYWVSGKVICARCAETGEPETRKVDIAA